MGKRIAFVGAGAVGGYVGGYLAHLGHDVTLIDPWPEHIETIRRDGLQLYGLEVNHLLARELLLAQSSDWAFLIKNGTAKDYAARRVTDHLGRFRRLQQQLTSNQVDKKFLSDCERRDNLFPKVNWRYYI